MSTNDSLSTIQHRKFSSIEEITPRLMAFDRKNPHGVVVCKGFRLSEVLQLMEMYADACVGKKMIDMGYKDHLPANIDYEGDLAKLTLKMAEWEELDA